MKYKFSFSSFVFASFLTITGCTNLIGLTIASPETIDVEAVKKEELIDDSLKVTGIVEKIIPMLDYTAYLLRDDQELIWVTTNKKAPKKFEAVTIKALIKNQVMIIEGEEYNEFYLEEIERIIKD